MCEALGSSPATKGKKIYKTQVLHEVGLSLRIPRHMSCAPCIHGTHSLVLLLLFFEIESHCIAQASLNLW